MGGGYQPGPGQNFLPRRRHPKKILFLKPAQFPEFKNNIFFGNWRRGNFLFRKEGQKTCFLTVFGPFLHCNPTILYKGEKAQKTAFFEAFFEIIFCHEIFFQKFFWDRAELFELVEKRTFFPDIDNVGKSYGGGTPWYPPPG